jgi:hypothetical protein
MQLFIVPVTTGRVRRGLLSGGLLPGRDAKAVQTLQHSLSDQKFHMTTEVIRD